MEKNKRYIKNNQLMNELKCNWYFSHLQSVLQAVYP